MFSPLFSNKVLGQTPPLTFEAARPSQLPKHILQICKSTLALVSQRRSRRDNLALDLPESLQAPCAWQPIKPLKTINT